MATSPSYFRTSFSLLFLLFLHLACLFLPSRNIDDQPPPPPSPRAPKRRKITPLSSPHNQLPDSTHSTSKFHSIRCYLRRLLCFRNSQTAINDRQQELLSPLSPAPIQMIIPLSPEVNGRIDTFDSTVPASAPIDYHQAAAKISLSELRASDSAHNIVRIIFESGWRGTSPPVVRRVLKIHQAARALARYEEYRDAVRARAAKIGDGRCVADGNERLRFYCTTTLCSWEAGAVEAGGCGSPYCCACAVVRHGFAGKQADLDGIATHATGWGAHRALPEELEREFAFLGARRAMLVCRVVAGRVLHRSNAGEEEEEEKGAGFDSVGLAGVGVGVGEDELLVFSPRAVLPCFVIIYST
ncbi:uncharacterized protein LOC122043226 [Zingiber officinale]|uniref:Uncharacterized protein n=1 Tax=Zingiber officinale TaxID=94328 RepID=A0A8J5HSK1_ZINOF|nr:uncharacterized protein LOC122043226 [Zingiber officinale]KAG6530348.1 hypothetical protein ZIOFF_012576 [Zingiber officinale]